MAQNGIDPFVAEIRMFPFQTVPTGWASCDGQLLPISQNTALFSLLGTWYGGDGKSTFALPNLQGCVPIGWGQSSTGTEYTLGQQSGSEAVTLLQSEMPVHSHGAFGSTENATVKQPDPNVFLGRSKSGTIYQSVTNANLTQMNFQALSITGSSFPHNNMMPFVTLSFCIALQGVFPPRG